MFLHETPEKWSIQEHFFAHAHNTQPISHQHNPPYEVNFQTLSRIPLNFPLNVSRNSFRECSAQTCSDWPPHSQYQLTGLNPIFRSIMSKPLSTWFFDFETTFYSEVYQNALKKNSFAIQGNLDKPLSPKWFFSHRNFELFNSRKNWNHFVYALSKYLTSIRKSHKNFSHKKEKHFTPIEIKRSHFLLGNLCSFLTSNHTLNKILNWFRILIRQTWFRTIYIIKMIILNLIIMFFMMIHSVMMMVMINQLCLILNLINLQKDMVMIIITFDQILILKIYFMNQDRQNVNPSTSFPYWEFFDLPKTDKVFWLS